MALNLKRMVNAILFYLQIYYSAGTTAGFGRIFDFVNRSIYEWYSDVMPDRFVGYMMRRRFEKCSFHVPSRWRWNYHASWAIWCSLRQSRFRWSQSAGAPPLCCFHFLSQCGLFLGSYPSVFVNWRFSQIRQSIFVYSLKDCEKRKKILTWHTIVAISYI